MKIALHAALKWWSISAGKNAGPYSAGGSKLENLDKVRFTQGRPVAAAEDTRKVNPYLLKSFVAGINSLARSV